MFRLDFDLDVHRGELTDQVDEDVGQVDILDRVVGIARHAHRAVVPESEKNIPQNVRSILTGNLVLLYLLAHNTCLSIFGLSDQRDDHPWTEEGAALCAQLDAGLV